MVNEITISKGAYSATIYAIKIEDGYKNKIFIITPGTGKSNQTGGPKDNKIVDLLRLTRSFRIDGYILSNTVKSDIIKIIEGANIDGGSTTFTFSEGGDATSFQVFFEDCVFRYESQDEPTNPPDNHGKHQISLTLIKGISVG
jgi:hypothetical protein